MAPSRESQIKGFKKPTVPISTLRPTPDTLAIKEKLIALIGRHMKAHRSIGFQGKFPPISHHRRVGALDLRMLHPAGRPRPPLEDILTRHLKRIFGNDNAFDLIIHS
jgi:hypothetical protein